MISKQSQIMDQTSSTLRKRFTIEEDNSLKHVVHDLGIRNWEDVAAYIPGRTARQCRDRYNNYLFKEISTSTFTPEEDAIILQKYSEIGPHWVAISKFLNGRSGNNVKNRWYKFLSKVCVHDINGFPQSSNLKTVSSEHLSQPNQIQQPKVYPVRPVSINNSPPIKPIIPSSYTSNIIQVPVNSTNSSPTFIPNPQLNQALPLVKLNNVSVNPNSVTKSPSTPNNPEEWINEKISDLLELDWENLVDFEKNPVFF